MHHDDDVRTLFQRQPVTGFLIASVAEIAFMHKNFRQRKILCDFHGIVRAGVVDKYNFIHDALRHDFIICFHDGFSGVVSRHDHHYLFILKHASFNHLSGYERFP
jgi:predicted TIM-barrel fold metal-dependent hydrolase